MAKKGRKRKGRGGKRTPPQPPRSRNVAPQTEADQDQPAAESRPVESPVASDDANVASVHTGVEIDPMVRLIDGGELVDDEIDEMRSTALGNLLGSQSDRGDEHAEGNPPDAAGDERSQDDIGLDPNQVSMADGDVEISELDSSALSFGPDDVTPTSVSQSEVSAASSSFESLPEPTEEDVEDAFASVLDEKTIKTAAPEHMLGVTSFGVANASDVSAGSSEVTPSEELPQSMALDVATVLERGIDKQFEAGEMLGLSASVQVDNDQSTIFDETDARENIDDTMAKPAPYRCPEIDWKVVEQVDLDSRTIDRPRSYWDRVARIGETAISGCGDVGSVSNLEITTAVAAEHLGEVDEALEHYQKAWKQGETQIAALVSMLAVSWRRGDTDEVAKSLSCLAQSCGEPARSEIYALLGDFLMVAGRASEAQQCIEQTHKKSLRGAFSHWALSPDEEVRERLCDLLPEGDLRSAICLEHARRSEAAGKLGAALANYRKASNSNPQSPGSWEGLIRLGQRLQKHSITARALAESAKFVPEWETHRIRRRAQLSQHHKIKGVDTVSDLRRASALANSNALVRQQFAQNLYSAGECIAASEQYAESAKGLSGSNEAQAWLNAAFAARCEASVDDFTVKCLRSALAADTSCWPAAAMLVEMTGTETISREHDTGLLNAFLESEPEGAVHRRIACIRQLQNVDGHELEAMQYLVDGIADVPTAAATLLFLSSRQCSDNELVLLSQAIDKTQPENDEVMGAFVRLALARHWEFDASNYERALFHYQKLKRNPAGRSWAARGIYRCLHRLERFDELVSSMLLTAVESSNTEADRLRLQAAHLQLLAGRYEDADRTFGAIRNGDQALCAMWGQWTAKILQHRYQDAVRVLGDLAKDVGVHAQIRSWLMVLLLLDDQEWATTLLDAIHGDRWEWLRQTNQRLDELSQSNVTQKIESDGNAIAQDAKTEKSALGDVQNRSLPIGLEDDFPRANTAADLGNLRRWARNHTDDRLALMWLLAHQRRHGSSATEILSTVRALNAGRNAPSQLIPTARLAHRASSEALMVDCLVQATSDSMQRKLAARRLWRWGESAETVLNAFAESATDSDSRKLWRTLAAEARVSLEDISNILAKEPSQLLGVYAWRDFAVEKQDWLQATAASRAEAFASQSTEHKISALLMAAEIAQTKLKDAKSAIAYLHEVLQLDGDHRVAFEQLVHLLTQTNQWSDVTQALADRTQVEKDAHRRHQLHFRLAVIATDRLLDLDLAAKHLALALEIEPDDGATLEALANIYEVQARYDDAADLLQRRIRSETEKADLKRVLLRIAAMQQNRLNNSAKALTALNRALAIDPNDTSTLERMADAYLKELRHEEALDVTRQLYDLEPDPAKQAHWLRRLATIYEDGIRDTSAAQKALQRALEIMPDDTETIGDIIGFYARQGDQRSVVVHLDRAVATMHRRLLSNARDVEAYHSLFRIFAWRKSADGMLCAGTGSRCSWTSGS